MDALDAWLTFTASAISSLAWPITAVFLVYLLRGHLPRLLRKITRISGPGFAADFAEDVQGLAAELGSPTPREVISKEVEAGSAVPRGDEPVSKDQESQLPAHRPRFTAVEKFRLNRLFNAKLLAADNPKAAVLMSWDVLQGALQDSAELARISTQQSVKDVIRALGNEGIISVRLEGILKQIHDLQTRAKHEPGFDPTLSSVLEYVDLVGSAIHELYISIDKLPR